MDLEEVGWGGTNSIYLAQEEVAGSCECSNTPSGSIKCAKFLDWGPIIFSGRTLHQGVSQLVV